MLEDFLQALTPDEGILAESYYESQIGFQMEKYTRQFPDLTEVNLAFVGVLEDRKAVQNEGTAQGPDKVRKALYQLNVGNFNLKMVDLGNILFDLN